MMNLYECTEIEQKFEALAEANGGELTPAMFEAIVLAQTSAIENVEKLMNYVAVLERQAESAQNECTRLLTLRDSCYKRVESIKEYIKPWLIAKGGKFKVGTWTLSTRKSTAVQLADNFDAAAYMVEKVVRSPDKKLIGETLKAGVSIPGAVLVERQNVQIK